MRTGKMLLTSPSIPRLADAYLFYPNQIPFFPTELAALLRDQIQKMENAIDELSDDVSNKTPRMT
jgi:hypothetical protein